MGYSRTRIKQEAVRIEVDGKVYESLSEAGRALGIAHTTLSKAVRAGKMYVTQITKKELRIRVLPSEVIEEDEGLHGF